MGLGKTAQTLAALHLLRHQERVDKPFLIVAPLSTVGHWAREAAAWTDQLAVVYHWRRKEGVMKSAKDSRGFLRDFEWRFPGCELRGDQVRFDILITTYETAVADQHHLNKLEWGALVVDEGHRLRSDSSRLKQALAPASVTNKGLKAGFRLLLTGTPLQNHAGELWSLLNFLEPRRFPTLEEFTDRFGMLETGQQVDALRRTIAPFLMRRVKEDVEKSIPKKEETIIDVELTLLQKQYYRAIYERNRSFLYRGCSTANMPGLNNVVMQLRKCCNHPYLIEGVEDKHIQSLAAANQGGVSHLQRLVKASGKLVLLDKLLPKLRAEGRRVLIFSQMVRMLDLITQYCRAKGFPMERLDGRVLAEDRQAAMDRFQDPDSNSFIFLLSTRAGGVGITLTAADTVIIFDSDWNPQNDSQAQARAHRIGQTKEVQVYRFLTKHTYEASMFQRASEKLALGRAVLAEGARGRQLAAPSPEELERMLREGARQLLGPEEDAEGAAAAGAGDEAASERKRFEAASIDELLQSNTRRVQVQAGGGIDLGQSSLKSAAGQGTDIDLHADDFWSRVLPGFQSASNLWAQLQDGLADPDEEPQEPAVAGKGGGTPGTAGKKRRRKRRRPGHGLFDFGEEHRGPRLPKGGLRGPKNGEARRGFMQRLHELVDSQAEAAEAVAAAVGDQHLKQKQLQDKELHRAIVLMELVAARRDVFDGEDVVAARTLQERLESIRSLSGQRRTAAAAVVSVQEAAASLSSPGQAAADDAAPAAEAYEPSGSESDASEDLAILRRPRQGRPARKRGRRQRLSRRLAAKEKEAEEAAAVAAAVARRPRRSSRGRPTINFAEPDTDSDEFYYSASSGADKAEEESSDGEDEDDVIMQLSDSEEAEVSSEQGEAGEASDAGETPMWDEEGDDGSDSSPTAASPSGTCAAAGGEEEAEKEPVPGVVLRVSTGQVAALEPGSDPPHLAVRLVRAGDQKWRAMDPLLRLCSELGLPSPAERAAPAEEEEEQEEEDHEEEQHPEAELEEQQQQEEQQEVGQCGAQETNEEAEVAGAPVATAAEVATGALETAAGGGDQAWAGAPTVAADSADQRESPSHV